MRPMINFKCDKQLTMKPLKIELIKPEFVYIKIDDAKHIIVTPGSYVYKGQILGIKEIPYQLPVISTVSGFYKEPVKINDGLFLKIENDYLEKYAKRIGYKKNLGSYKKSEFIDLLYQNAVVGQGGAGYPTYLKYSAETPINLLIVNAIECEPNLTSDYVTMLKHTENILDAIDAILNITKIERAVIAVNSEYNEVIEKFNEYLGSYPEIILQIINVKYPVGQSKLLVEQITGETYKRHASEIGVIVNNVSTIYNVYRVLKYRRPVTEKVITLTGDKMAKKHNVLVKIGMSAGELNLTPPEDAHIVHGGPLIGNAHNDLNFILGPTSLAVMFLAKSQKTTEPCINCGYCQTYCPMHVRILAIKKMFAERSFEKLALTDAPSCIECGLCSYVCPANISLRELAVKAKEVIKNEK